MTRDVTRGHRRDRPPSASPPPPSVVRSRHDLSESTSSPAQLASSMFAMPFLPLPPPLLPRCHRGAAVSCLPCRLAVSPLLIAFA
jgi:hypothetical protein